MVFDKEWFQQNNRTLCWFANQAILKYWFRWLLRIHKDIKWSDTVNQITPNSFTYNAKLREDKIELTTDFRTHEKFGKRLYYGLKPLWYLLHFWDWSTSIQPVLNCGFDTLTVYPQAGSGGANETVDGYPSDNLNSLSFTNLRNESGSYAGATDASGYFFNIASTSTSDVWSNMARSIFTIKTSALTSDATISAAVFSVYGTTDTVDNYNQSCCLVASTPTSDNALVNGDFAISHYGSTELATRIDVTSWNTSSYNDFTLNTDGKAAISKTGITKFGGRGSSDLDNSAPTWESAKQGAAYIKFADDTSGTKDPKLVVTYTLPATSSVVVPTLLIMGVG